MAHFRESNAVFLEILGPSPAAGVPLEVDVFDGANPGTLIETLDGATNIAFTTPFNDVGGGGFRISRHDPKATPEIVGREHLFKIKVGGIYRFSFWGEHRELVTLDSRAEQGGEFWEISGRGAIAYLDRATMANYSLIGDDPQAGGKWPLHLAGTGSSLGAMFNRCLQERLAEPGSPIEFLTQNWNYTYDSQSNLWGDTAEITVTTGDSLLDIWKQFTALGMDSRMRHDLRIEAYVELGRHYDVTGGTGTVVLRAGKHFTSTIRRAQHTNEVKSRLWVKGSGDAWYEISDAGLEADPYVRRREGSLSFGNSDDPSTLQRAGNAELAARAQQVEGGISIEVTNNGPGDYVPYVDYDVGDWVTIHEPGVYDLQTVRIVGMSIEQVEQTYTTRLDLNTIEYDELVQLARRMNRGGGAGGSTGASAGLNAPAGSGESAIHPGVAVHDGMGLVTDAELASELANLDLNALVDVDTVTTPPDDGQALVFDDASGLWVPGDVASGGGGDPLPLPDYTEENAQVNVSTSQALITRTITLPAGRYLLIGKAWVWSGGIGTLRLRANAVSLDGSDDPRTYGGQRILFAHYVHGGGSVTFDIYHFQESGTTQYGGSGDARFGRELLIVPLSATSGSAPGAMLSAYSAVAAAVTDAAATYDLPGLSIAGVTAGTYKAELGFHISNKSGQIRVSISNAADVTLWPLASAARTTWGPNTDSGKEFEGSGIIVVAADTTVKARAAASAAIGNYTIYDRHLTLTRLA